MAVVNGTNMETISTTSRIGSARERGRDEATCIGSSLDTVTSPTATDARVPSVASLTVTATSIARALPFGNRAVMRVTPLIGAALVLACRSAPGIIPRAGPGTVTRGSGQARCPHRLEAKDSALSRRQQGFEFPWGHQR